MGAMSRAVSAKIFNCKVMKKVPLEGEVIFRLKLQHLSNRKSGLSLEHRDPKVFTVDKEGEGRCFHVDAMREVVFVSPV